MGNLASFLIAMARPILVKIMTSLGLAVVTYAGTNIALGQIREAIASNFGGLPSEVASILGLIGLGQVAGILLGAVAYKLSMSAFKRIAVTQ